MNPLDEYFAEKKAADVDFLRHTGNALAGGLGTAVGAAGVAAVGMAASKIYDAVTKGRDFKQMLQSPFNQDLHELYKSQPSEFNAAFSSLRAMTPEFSKDPMVSGTYMRRMMSFGPTSAGGVILESVGAHKNMPSDNPLREAFMGGAGAGAAQGYKGSIEEDRKQTSGQADRAHQTGLKEREIGARREDEALKHQHGMQSTQYAKYLDMVAKEPFGNPQMEREHNARTQSVLTESPNKPRNKSRFG